MSYIEKAIKPVLKLISSDSVTFMKFLTAVAARTGAILNYAGIAGDMGDRTNRQKLDFYFGADGTCVLSDQMANG